MAKATPQLPKLLTLEQVSDLLGVSKKTVQRLIKRGELPRYKIGARVGVSEQDYRAFVAMRRDL